VYSHRSARSDPKARFLLYELPPLWAVAASGLTLATKCCSFVINRGGASNLVLGHLVINVAGTQDLIAAAPDQKFLEDWVYTPAVRRRT
jgi:hypothetical protein